jgi:hypothetical protein
MQSITCTPSLQGTSFEVRTSWLYYWNCTVIGLTLLQELRFECYLQSYITTGRPPMPVSSSENFIPPAFSPSVQEVSAVPSQNFVATPDANMSYEVRPCFIIYEYLNWSMLASLAAHVNAECIYFQIWRFWHIWSEILVYHPRAWCEYLPSGWHWRLNVRNISFSKYSPTSSFAHANFKVTGAADIANSPARRSSSSKNICG